jgi:hypothetical protein
MDLDWELRLYSRRYARNADGSLRDATETDAIRNLTFGFNSAISEHWAFYFQFNQQAASSNNHDQTSALYNYQLNTTALGVNFSY